MRSVLLVSVSVRVLASVCVAVAEVLSVCAGGRGCRSGWLGGGGVGGCGGVLVCFGGASGEGWQGL